METLSRHSRKIKAESVSRQLSVDYTSQKFEEQQIFGSEMSRNAISAQSLELKPTVVTSCRLAEVVKTKEITQFSAAPSRPKSLQNARCERIVDSCLCDVITDQARRFFDFFKNFATSKFIFSSKSIANKLVLSQLAGFSNPRACVQKLMGCFICRIKLGFHMSSFFAQKFFFKTAQNMLACDTKPNCCICFDCDAKFQPFFLFEKIVTSHTRHTRIKLLTWENKNSATDVTHVTV